MQFGEFIPIFNFLFIIGKLEVCLVKKKELKSTITQLETNINGVISKEDNNELALFENKSGRLNDGLNKIFNTVFSKCDKNDIDAYIEEQQIKKNKNDRMWFSVNYKKFINILKENSHNEGLLKFKASEAKLPKLTLQAFSDNLEECLLFYYLFTASMNYNESLTEF